MLKSAHTTIAWALDHPGCFAYGQDSEEAHGILRHIGGAEWWYQDRLGYALPEDEEDDPEDPFKRMTVVREHLTSLLPKRNGMNKVVGIAGELWSPRKMLRRAVWHERDHTEHIRKLLA